MDRTLHGRGGTRRAGHGPGLRRALSDVDAFSAAILGVPLRRYQSEVARAVLRSISEARGHQLTVLMPRQSGKNQIPADRL
ncbi:MAG: hypothetical protein AB7P40_20795 [Chloroflexota bacterium]